MKTAVEWLMTQLPMGLKLIIADKLEQAKAMEKEQIMKAYGQGVADEVGEVIDATKDAEQYYNKPFGDGQK